MPLLSGGILGWCDGDIFQARLPDTTGFDYLRIWRRDGWVPGRAPFDR